jgi:hypothetical protein
MREYYGPACVVLWAAAIGTRQAKAVAMELLPAARAYEADRFRREDRRKKNPGETAKARSGKNKQNNKQ